MVFLPRMPLRGAGGGRRSERKSGTTSQWKGLTPSLDCAHRAESEAGVREAWQVEALPIHPTTPHSRALDEIGFTQYLTQAPNSGLLPQNVPPTTGTQSP